MKKISFALSSLFFFALSAPALSHGGRLDQYGCHRVRATGGYHCHHGNRNSGSNGDDGIARREPTCRDIQSRTRSVSLFKTSISGDKTLWLQQSNVQPTSGEARLLNEPGTLSTYRVQGVQVRHFENSTSSRNRFSFDGSPWINASNVSQIGNTQITSLNANPLSIHSQEKTTSITSDRVCN